MRQLACKAAEHWAIAESDLHLIAHRENAVFSATLPDGSKAALRIHRRGYNSEGEIRSELWWAEALAARGFPTPLPIPSAQGALTARLPDGHVASLVEWIDATAIGSGDTPLPQTLPDKINLYRQIGALLANLHKISDNLTLPTDFQRRKWDLEGLLGDSPHWGRFWENPLLDDAQRRELEHLRQDATEILAEYTGDFGLIHADALRENIMQDARGLTLIDLDDSGFGWRLYDLAVALSQGIEDADYPALRNAILQGYADTRPLPDRAEELFALFAALRAGASLGWCATRVPPGSAAMRRYLHRALLAIEKWRGR